FQGDGWMIKNFKKLITDYFTVILFITGIVLIDIGTIFFNNIFGIIVTGISLIVMAVVSDKERG
ncbi:hypothetical protein, partial [Oenococcus oeni]|uniref:hypothetical protein n=2 Tax=Oenococcus oeni TaxID=1247 RepID=UPI0008F7EBB2